jgi:hypothetical protein
MDRTANTIVPTTVKITQTYVVYGMDPYAYSMDPSNLCCLPNGPIKLMLLTVWTHQTYVVYGMDDRTANTIVPTTVKITPVMLCLVSVYLVVEKVEWANTVNKVNLWSTGSFIFFPTPCLLYGCSIC